MKFIYRLNRKKYNSYYKAIKRYNIEIQTVSFINKINVERLFWKDREY